MPTTLNSFCSYSDTLLDSASFTDYGPNGLQVEGGKTIKTCAVAVSASLAAIEGAISAHAEVLLVHHGLFWKGDSPLVVGIRQKKLKLLLENNVSLVAYHLPLDAHRQYGNNWKAARELGWKNLKPFLSLNGSYIGVRGTFSVRSREKFQSQLEEYYMHPAHVALGGPAKVASAALVSGGAHRNITDAIACGVDCYVTGSFDEPIWHAAYEDNINFYALGHAATERIGPQALGRHLCSKFKLDYVFLDDPNPF